MYDHTRRKPKGYGVITGINGNSTEFDTEQCCHCGRHFQIVKGSGTKRGFCLHCNKVTCGSPQCDECIPFEEQLKRMEQQANSGIIFAR